MPGPTPPPRTPRRIPAWVLALVAVLVAAAAWSVIGALRLPGRGGVAKDRPIAVDTEGYVSSDTCGACHPEQYASWHDSYHRTMTQVVTPQTAVAPLDGTTLEFQGTTWHIQRRGDRFFVTERSREAGREVVKERPIVMSTGSHTMQLYWMASEDGRLVEMLPFHYLIEEKRWIPRQASFLIPPGKNRFGALWNTGCIHCHTTRGEPRVTRTGVDTHVAEFGIACEACHGPGYRHVEANRRSPLRRYALHLTGDHDDTIVNPSRLSQERASEVCGRCHAYGAPVNPDFRFAGFRYKPGEDLSRSRRVYERSQFHGKGPLSAADRMFWKDGMVRGSGREFGGMMESPCFKRGDMTCLSCHEMHESPHDTRPAKVWAEDQLRPGMRGNAACAECHPKVAEHLEQHTHHRADSEGSNCYNCHMSYTTYGLLKAIRSHEVDSPSVQTTLETGRPNACNQCHLDKTLEWAAQHLHEDWGVPEPHLEGETRDVAASVLLLLRGDAAQRALMAWSYGWDAAREASGTDWMAPYLAQLLEDPYPAIRFIAHRSLESLPGFGALPYDFLGSPQELRDAHHRALARWEATAGARPALRPAALIDEDGLRREVFARLLSERDDRPVVVME